MHKPKNGKDAVFDSFVGAFKLKVGADFREGFNTYAGVEILGGAKLSMAEVKGTPEYVGFVDGYGDRAERFKGPSGSPDSEGTNAIANVQVFKTGIIDQLVKTYNIEGSKSLEEKNRERYKTGFIKGCAARP